MAKELNDDLNLDLNDWIDALENLQLLKAMNMQKML